MLINEQRLKGDFMYKFKTLLYTLLFICLVDIQAYASGYIKDDFTPTPELVELFREFSPIIKTCKSIPAEKIAYILNPNTPNSQITITDLAKIAQEKFKRPNLMERRDIASFNEQFLPFDSPRVRDLIKKLGDYDPKYPKVKNPKYILVNGSTIQRMQKRVWFLAELVNTHKITITSETEIFFLTGDRDLYPEENSFEMQFGLSKYPQNKAWQAPKSLAQTEYQAAKNVWWQLDLPQSLRKLKITFINAEKRINFDQKTGKKTFYRPNTMDTLIYWINAYHLHPGHCISISNQPFVKYQELVVQRGLQQEKRQGFTVEGVGGAELNKDYLLAIYLDNIARSLYELNFIQSLKQLQSNH